MPPIRAASYLALPSSVYSTYTISLWPQDSEAVGGLQLSGLVQLFCVVVNEQPSQTCLLGFIAGIRRYTLSSMGVVFTATPTPI